MRAIFRNGGSFGWAACLAFACVQLFAAAAASAQTWTSQDIGSVAAAGSAGQSGGQIAVGGSGRDIWDYADAFQFYQRQWTGDGVFVARLTNLDDTHPWAKAGIMFRETLSADSRHVMICGTGESGTNLTFRTATGGGTGMTGVTWSTFLPVWLKIVRSGDTFTGYTSFDGTQWTQAGTATLVNAPATLYAGFALTSHNDGVLAHATFDNVSTSGPAPAAPTITSPTYVTGLVGSPFSYAIQATNSPTQFGAPSAPLWMSLDPSTGVITGAPPTAGTVTFTVSATNAYGTGQQSVTLVINDTGASWTSQDIGAVGFAGSSNDNGAAVTVNASGADIWDTSDEFHFRYLPLNRDGELVARVTSLTVTNQWAKAGLMIRDSLAPNARYHWIGTSAQNGSFAQTRSTIGGYTGIYFNSWNTVFPTWLRIQRLGDRVYSYFSTDGVTWKSFVQWGPIDPASTQYIGFAVTSHDDSRICTAVFDNAQLTIASPSVAPAAPTNITLTAPNSGQVSISWTDNSGNETQFQILRSTDNVTFPVVGTTGANVTSFEDTTVTGGTTYYYQIRAINVYGASPYTGSVSITTPVGSVWGYRDIGAVGVAGSNSSGANTITVSGAGADVWGSLDGLRYVYRAVQGDVTVEAQVTSFSATQSWARAGVMIRESLDPAARNVFGFVTHDTLVASQIRPSASTILKAAYYDSRPQWIRLVKTAARVSVQTSPSGTTWTEIAAYDFPLGQTFYVGFAVSSHDTSQLATAVFTDPAVR